MSTLLPYINNRQVYSCPSEQTRNVSLNDYGNACYHAAGDLWYCGYALNAIMTWYSPYATRIREMTSHTGIFVDSNFFIISHGSWTLLANARHTNGCNLAYADGHVDWQTGGTIGLGAPVYQFYGAPYHRFWNPAVN